MARRCIFCGGKPVTKEHIFGLWLSPLFPPPPAKRIYLDKQTFVKGQPSNQTRRYPLNLDLQVKQVCRSCNNGWMSDLERATMGIISTIHNTTKHFITSEEQASLASWAIKTSVMIQYIDNNPVVPEYRRQWLFNHHTPPPDTCVWIARYDGAGIATSLSKRLFVEDNPKDLNCPNGQVVFFSIGTLLFVVLSLYLKFKNVGVRTVFPERLTSHLLRIWPENSQLLFWPFQGIDDSLRAELNNLNWGETLRFPLLNPL